MIVSIIVISVSCNKKSEFDTYFENKSLRIDYMHSGNHIDEYINFDELIEEPFWGGSKKNLIDTLNYGHYFMKVLDKASKKVIYSHGFSSLFREWQTTERSKSSCGAYDESLIIPYPKNDVIVELYGRDSVNNWRKDAEFDIAMNKDIRKPDPKNKYPYQEILKNGDPSEKVDIVILPEGYTKEDMDLFIKDCKKFSKGLFEIEPFKANQSKFNVYAVTAPSKERGSDIPEDSVFRETLLSTSFYTFESERYCMSIDPKTVRSVAANVPYDQIYILVNTNKYGGGAIYNYYSLSVNSNEDAAKIFVHELGHGFAGLGDEYYDSSVAYSDFYSKNAEPWEPNLTTLTHFDRKWKSMISQNIPIPTPNDTIYNGKIGVFEGGGYVAKDVYRPSMDCLMNSFKGNTFCKVCSKSIQEMIDFHTN